MMLEGVASGRTSVVSLNKYGPGLHHHHSSPPVSPIMAVSNEEDLSMVLGTMQVTNYTSLSYTQSP